VKKRTLDKAKQRIVNNVLENIALKEIINLIIQEANKKADEVLLNMSEEDALSYLGESTKPASKKPASKKSAPKKIKKVNKAPSPVTASKNQKKKSRSSKSLGAIMSDKIKEDILSRSPEEKKVEKNSPKTNPNSEPENNTASLSKPSKSIYERTKNFILGIKGFFKPKVEPPKKENSRELKKQKDLSYELKKEKNTAPRKGLISRREDIK